MNTQYRKQDAHEKIQLGGLVVKAGLREVDKAVILGALLEVAKAYDDADQVQIERWASTGDEAFLIEE